jgi:hypothetical protein
MAAAQCITIIGNPRIGTGRKCRRTPVWHIKGIGTFCDLCFTRYFDEHWREISVDRIERTSDCERDFFHGTTGGLAVKLPRPGIKVNVRVTEAV